MAVLAKVSLMIGLLLVVVARSCESLNFRTVDRADAKYDEARAERGSSRFDGDDDDSSRLKGLREDVRDAEIGLRMNGLWYELLFMLGTILLLLGLVGVGFAGSGSERMVAMVMIAVITFSIFVFGVAWLPKLRAGMG